MAVTKQFIQLDEIHQGTTRATNLKMLDAVPMQHEDLSSGTNKLAHLRFAQVLCNPVATAGNHTGGVYSASVLNFPDFAIKYQDSQQNYHYLVGMKVRVIFNNGITYGSVSGGTYPSLNVGDTEALPLLAQGKTMASGACTSGQSLELTLIPYGNGYAWDADSNVREANSDYTVYTDGSITYKNNVIIRETINDANITDNGFFIFSVGNNTSNIPATTFTRTKGYIRHYHSGDGNIVQEFTATGYDEYYNAISEQYIRGSYFDGVNYHFGNWSKL